MKASTDLKRLILLITATLSMVVYLYLNLPLNQLLPSLPGIWFALPGDMGSYIWRFAASTIFFALIPGLVALILGFRPQQLGLSKPGTFWRDGAFWLLLALMAISGIAAAPFGELANFYPFAKSLISLVKNQPAFLLVHALCYFLFYYLPWEFLFRGILIFPFLPETATDTSPKPFAVNQFLVIAAMQMIPTTLLHINHPLPEIIGAIPFGLVTAWLAIRYKSIWPGLIIHACVGIGVDTIIIFTR